MENIANFEMITIMQICLFQQFTYVYSSRKHGTGTEILQKLGTYFNHLFYSDYLQSSIQFYRIWRI